MTFCLDEREKEIEGGNRSVGSMMASDVEFSSRL